MKKIIPFLITSLVLSLSSCKDDNKSGTLDDSYTARLVGVWTLKSVDYEADVNLAGTPIPIAGSGTSLDGSIAFTQQPNTYKLDLKFNAAVDLGGGVPIPIPIDETSQGTWTTTADDSKIIVTDDQGMTTLFEVVTNESNRQVFKGTMTQDAPIIGKIDVDVVLEFTR